MIETIHAILNYLAPLFGSVVVALYLLRVWRQMRLDRFRAAALNALVGASVRMLAERGGGKVWYLDTAAIAEHLAQAMLQQTTTGRIGITSVYSRDNAPCVREHTGGDYVEIAKAPDA